MRTMLRIASVYLAVLAGGVRAGGVQGPSLGTAPPTAQEVMARVAANQDAAEAERAHYVYVRHARMASRKGKTVQCEELTDYRITPSSDGSHEELLKLDGRLRVKGKYVIYNALKPDDGDKAGKDKDGKGTPPQDEDTSGKAGQDRGIHERAATDKDAGDAKNENAAKGDDDTISVSIGEEGVDRGRAENMG